MGQHDDKKGTENTSKELKRQQKALSFLEDFSRKIAAFFMCTFLRIFRKKQIIFLYACAGAPERAKACTAVAIKASQSGVALHSPQPSAFHAFDLVRRGLPFGGNAFYGLTVKVSPSYNIAAFGGYVLHSLAQRIVQLLPVYIILDALEALSAVRVGYSVLKRYVLVYGR